MALAATSSNILRSHQKTSQIITKYSIQREDRRKTKLGQITKEMGRCYEKMVKVGTYIIQSAQSATQNATEKR